MTTGIVSGLARSLPAGSQTPTGTRFSIPDIIQTDAAINPGNSGGPLLNLDGEVIGVNTAIESTRGSFAGIGYAVPADTVNRVAPQLIESGQVENPWLGISGVSMNSALAEAMELDEDQRGVLIMQVMDDSPAAAADLQGSDTEVTIDGLTAQVGGDIIVGINEQEVVQFEDLLSYIVAETAVGETVTLEILRDGEMETVEVTMEARPGNE
jgi:2-alkenal reductase